MQYAIVEINGKQYKVSAGDVINVELSNPGEKVEFDKVLLLSGDKIEIGQPLLQGKSVKGSVLKTTKGPKVRVSKFKAKSNYHNTKGYRSTLTQVKIDSL